MTICAMIALTIVFTLADWMALLASSSVPFGSSANWRQAIARCLLALVELSIAALIC